jgi:hypothetical protein
MIFSAGRRRNKTTFARIWQPGGVLGINPGIIPPVAAWAPRDRFEDTNLCAIHAKRVTIMPKDIQLARRPYKGVGW